MILHKIKKIIQRLLHTRKVWRSPRESHVLIYDGCNFGTFFEYVQSWSPEILYTRGEEINIPVFIRSLFRAGSRSQSYVDQYISMVKPKLIITFIDNSLSFYRLRSRHPYVKTLFIQNGWRGYYADVFEHLDKMPASAREELQVDYMLTFGSLTGEHYKKYIKGESYPIGSIKSNKVSLSRKKTGTLAFISQYIKDGFYMNGIYYSQERFFKEIDGPIIAFLKTYAERNNKTFYIIPRNLLGTPNRHLEENYYQDFLGFPANFLEPQGTYPAYLAIDMAEVSVTVDSTLGYESLARGNKTAFFAVRSRQFSIPALNFAWPKDYADEGPFWTNQLRDESFKKILDQLYSFDDKDWSNSLKAANFKEIMEMDPENRKLKSLLLEILT